MRDVSEVRGPASERRGLTVEQRERRVVVEARQRLLQAGVRRGPNAPKDGTFGGKPAA